MSLAVTHPSAPRRQPKSKSKSRDQYHILSLLSEARTTYTISQFSQTLSKHLTHLTASSPTPITRLLSLGLGSLSSPEKGQTRRLKQLAVLLSIRDTLQTLTKGPIEAYAQDPTFTHADEALLQSLGVRIARTSSGSSLGEAAQLLDAGTVVYSPFLTLEAYEELLVKAKSPVQYLVGDDFNALVEKWPKRSAERAQVERVTKAALGRYRRKAVSGAGFWEESDGSFPMAVYAVPGSAKERVRAKI